MQVTSENKNNVEGPGISGTVKYDSDTNTLTLENANITGVYKFTTFYTTYGKSIYFKNGLTINLVGNNTLTMPDNEEDINYSTGIGTDTLATGDLTIKGDGTINITNYTSGIFSCRYGTLTIKENVKINITTSKEGDSGIASDAFDSEKYSITIKDNAQVTVTADGAGGYNYGIVSNNSILITDNARVHSEAGKSNSSSYYSSGIWVGGGGKVTISANAVVYAAGNDHIADGRVSCGVYGNYVEVLGSGKLTAIGGNTSEEYSYSSGILVTSSVIISDMAQVTAMGGRTSDSNSKSYGIGGYDYYDHSIQIASDMVKVKAQGGTRAFSKHPVEGGNEPLDIPGWNSTDMVIYPPDPIYSIELDRSGTYSFPGKYTGYESVTPLTVGVSNTGNQATGDLTVELGGVNKDNFMLSTRSIRSLDVSGKDSFTVVPKAGLGAGTYTVRVTVKGDKGILVSFEVSFSVSKKSEGSISNPFTDIKKSDWFYNTVLQVYDRGIFIGSSSTNFNPNSPMTRGMFVTALARMDGIDLSSFTSCKFKDVDMSKYYGPATAWAYKNGIVGGYGNSLFGPEDSITREQMAVILANYIRIKHIKISIVSPKTAKYADDSQISLWAKDSIYTMKAYGLMIGRSGYIYAPKGIATRAEAAQAIFNLINAIRK